MLGLKNGEEQNKWDALTQKALATDQGGVIIRFASQLSCNQMHHWMNNSVLGETPYYYMPIRGRHWICQSIKGETSTSVRLLCISGPLSVHTSPA